MRVSYCQAAWKLPLIYIHGGTAKSGIQTVGAYILDSNAQWGPANLAIT